MKYFFLVGLPRTGNTLLSSILNQNPTIKVSANSILSDYIWKTYGFFYSDQFKNFPDKKSIDNLLSSAFDTYYKDWDAKYIIDRGPWGTPLNLDLLKIYLKNEIKMICTVRDMVDIIASSRRIGLEDGNNMIEKFSRSLHHLLKEENRKYLHLVEYKDLITSTQKTIEGIYSFLNIEPYHHNYNHIDEFSANGIKYDDSMYPNLHQVHPHIKSSSYRIKDILSEEEIKKYSNKNFWRL